jgi:N-sulfoglucosamine sulfohydrolase
MERPNVLYLHSHDTARYIQPYGHAIPTPNLQRLAEQGVLFRQAFCAGPTCSPSRAALLTGQSPHSSGMLGLAHRRFGLSDYKQHIIHTLRKVGYSSTLIGVQHIASDREIIGYDQILPTGDSAAQTVASVAAEFLGAAPKSPFFLAVGCRETHRKFSDPDLEDGPRYTLPPAPLPDTPETRRDMAAFKKDARRMDQGWGTVLDALEASGLAGDTLVICTTDHGIAFPGMKCNLTDHGIGVMLIVRGPGGFDGGKVIDGMVSHIDVFPTICDLVGIEIPPWVEGKSVLPLVRGEVDQIHEEIFAEVTYHAAYEPMRCVRTRRYKYIKHFDKRRKPVLANSDDSPSKDVWLNHGWKDRYVPEEELYDLIFDPCERNNLASEPSMAPERTSLRDRLTEWMQQTDDPLLKGSVPLPPESLVSDQDDISPHDVHRGRGITE